MASRADLQLHIATGRVDLQLHIAASRVDLQPKFMAGARIGGLAL
jgi:hypothetical protein